MQTSNIPTLRFPEFQGNWIGEKFGEYVLNSAFGPRFSSNLYNQDGTVATLRTTDMDNEGNIDYLSMPLADLSVDQFSDHILEDGDIVVSRSGTIGVTGVFVPQPIPVLPGAFLIRFRINKGRISSYFIKYLFNSLKGRIRLNSLSAGGVQKNLTGTNVKSAEFSFPTLPEQQKIASFLTAVDTKIEQLTKKKTLLEQYKKGVMQGLFSQKHGLKGLRDDTDLAESKSEKSQNPSHLRFRQKDGNDYPDWEEKRYDEIYSFYTTNSFSRDNLNYEDGEVLNIHYGDIHTKFSTEFDIENEEVPFVNGDIDLSKIKDECYCKEGDLVIADASEDYNDIGKTIEIVNLNGQKVLAGLHTFLARPTKLKMSKGFSGHMLKTWKVRKQVMKIAQGTKVLGLATGRLGKVILEIPCVEEQTQIADFFNAIDDKIGLVSKQLENTQGFKKGLLQKMFV